MTTIYVDNIAPNLQSKISAPNLTLPTGSVLQVQNGTTLTGGLSTTSASYVATGVKVTITPTSANSKIYITANSGIQNGTGGGGTQLGLFRKIGSGTSTFLHHQGGSGLISYDAGNNHITPGTFVLLDSPNTTSAVEYEINYKRYNTGTSYFFANAQIVAMEIAG